MELLATGSSVFGEVTFKSAKSFVCLFVCLVFQIYLIENESERGVGERERGVGRRRERERARSQSFSFWSYLSLGLKRNPYF